MRSSASHPAGPHDISTACRVCRLEPTPSPSLPLFRLPNRLVTTARSTLYSSMLTGIGNRLIELGVVLERNKVSGGDTGVKAITQIQEPLHPELHCVRIVPMITSNNYIAPASFCINGYQSSIEHLLRTPDSLLGDFNTHHPSWYSRSTDTRGRKMADSINESDYGIMNWDSPTTQNRVCQMLYQPLSSHHAPGRLLTLSSDHLPIFIRLQMKTPSNPGLRQTYVNLKKDNWE